MGDMCATQPNRMEDEEEKNTSRNSPILKGFGWGVGELW